MTARLSGKNMNTGEKELEKLRNFQRSSTANKKCFDCGERGPTYVCMEVDFKIFVCTSCSGLHRELSHKVKGISVSKWTMEDVDSIVESGGNEAAEKVLLASWRQRDDDLIDSQNIDKMRNFIRMKYSDRRWAAPRKSENRRLDRQDSGRSGKKDMRKEERQRDAGRGYSDQVRGERKTDRRESDDFNPGGQGDLDWGDPFEGQAIAPHVSPRPSPAIATELFTLEGNPETAQQHVNGSGVGKVLPPVKVLTKEEIARFSLEEVRKLQSDMEEHMNLMMRTMNAQIEMLKERAAALNDQYQQRLQSQQSSSMIPGGELELSGLNLDFNAGIATPSQLSAGPGGSPDLSSLHSQSPHPSLHQHLHQGLGGGSMPQQHGSQHGLGDMFSQTRNSQVTMNTQGTTLSQNVHSSMIANVGSLASQSMLRDNAAYANGMTQDVPRQSGIMPQLSAQGSMGNISSGSQASAGVQNMSLVGNGPGQHQQMGGGGTNLMRSGSMSSQQHMGGYRGTQIGMMPVPEDPTHQLTSLDTLTINFQNHSNGVGNPFMGNEPKKASGNPFDIF